MMTSKIPIVIPYIASEAQGNELELAVTGWRRHFLCDYQIFVVGDPHPIISTGDDIAYIQCPRVKPSEGNYLPHMDHVNKFVTVCEQLTDLHIPGFIYTCDDIYPVNDFGMEEVAFPKVVGHMSDKDSDVTMGWWGDLQRTRRKCVEEGLPTWDWVCHLPVFYVAPQLMRIYQKYKCYRTSYVVENLYFNEYRQGRVPLILNGEDNLRYSVDTNPLDSFEFDKALRNKIWITNSVSGWSQELEDRLRKHYQTK